MGFENATLSTVDDISNAFRLVVPEFQRGYAWGRDQWQALWDDAINVAARAHAEHYAGAIMIRSASSEAGWQEVELIDGQQRMTTIAILLRSLGDLGFPIRFRENEALQTYYDFYARGEEHLGPRLAEHRSFYARNLENAAEFFRNQCDGLSLEQRGALKDVLLKRFKLFVLAIQPAFDVHVAFETINNRGKPLSTLEKLKNRLIYLASNAEDQAAGRAAMTEVHQCWKGIYTWLGRGQRLLGDDAFLRAHSFGWFRHERRSDWLTTQLFEEEFGSHSNVRPAEIQTYVRSLENAAVWWHYLNEPQHLPGEARRRLDSLHRTASASTRPLLLWALVCLASADTRLVTNPSRDAEWIQPFLGLIEQAERFAVLVLWANDRQSNIGQGDLNRSAYALAHPGERIYPEILTSLPPLDPAGAVVFARDHAKSLVGNWTFEAASYDERRDARFDWEGFFRPEKVQPVIADRLRKDTGFYNWHLGKLLIYRWEEWLRGDRGLPEKKAWNEISWDESVEHIYPQNPDARWGDAVTFDGRTAGRLRSAVGNSLGNLLLLSGRRNSSVSNRPYICDEKTPGKRERFRGGSYSEDQVARICQEWTVVHIAARGIAMMRLAQRTWGFELVRNDARLTDWLPILFGDQSERIQEGDATGGKRIDGRTLTSLVQKFETLRAG